MSFTIAKVWAFSFLNPAFSGIKKEISKYTWCPKKVGFVFKLIIWLYNVEIFFFMTTSLTLKLILHLD